MYYIHGVVKDIVTSSGTLWICIVVEQLCYIITDQVESVMLLMNRWLNWYSHEKHPNKFINMTKPI